MYYFVNEGSNPSSHKNIWKPFFELSKVNAIKSACSQLLQANIFFVVLRCDIETKKIFKLQRIKTRSHLIGSVHEAAQPLAPPTGLEPVTS